MYFRCNNIDNVDWLTKGKLYKVIAVNKFMPLYTVNGDNGKPVKFGYRSDEENLEWEFVKREVTEKELECVFSN